MAYLNRDRFEPPDCDAVAEFHCPVCGEELQWNDRVYEAPSGDVVGCCKCLWEKDAEDAL